MDARRQGFIATRSTVGATLAGAASVGRLHIVAIAALGCFTFGWLFTGHYPWAMAAVCALDWFLVNLLNPVVDLREDQLNGIPATDFVARNRRLILVAGFTTLGISLLALAPVWPWLVPLRLAYHLLGFAYNWPLFPSGTRIKQLYFWKNSASAMGFMLTVFGYPLAWQRGALAPGISVAAVVAAGIYFFLFELSYEVIYDLRDAPGAARAGVRTYPVVHGDKVAVAIVNGLCLAAVAALVAAYATRTIPWRMFILVAGPCLQMWIFRRIYKRGIRSRDCINLTWIGASLLLAYHGWVLARLPGLG
jgi:4-hydroxybenzoate polyprenyltransferase